MTISIPEVLKNLVSKVESFGRSQAKDESNPVTGFEGVYQRVVAGFTKSDEHDNQKIYGISVDSAGAENADHLVNPGERQIYFAGKVGISTLKRLHELVDTVIKFQRDQVPNLTMEQAIEWLIDRFNHAWNIQQRTNYRLSQSYSTGVKPLNDLSREAVKTIDPEVLASEYQALIERLKRDAAEGTTTEEEATA